MKTTQVNKVFLPISNKKKLAIFDLDETLIHCISEKQVKSDTGSSTFVDADVVLAIKYWDGDEQLPINIRPFFKEWLKEIKKEYQIIIFTASK